MTSTDKNNVNKTGCFYGIGVGPGDPELLTLKASRILSNVPVIFIPKKDDESSGVAYSIISHFIKSGQQVIPLVLPMSRDRQKLLGYWQKAADTVWQRLEKGEDCALINLGDPLLYGSFIYIWEVLKRDHPGIRVEVISGISSVNAAAASALVPLAINNDRVAVISGKCEEGFLRDTLQKFDTVVFMKVNSIFDRIKDILEELKLSHNCYYVKQSTTDREEVITDLNKLEKEKLDYFSLLIVRK
jgi:precorrin-2/cobalt-factor-2 C20-methyltransferase